MLIPEDTRFPRTASQMEMMKYLLNVLVINKCWLPEDEKKYIVVREKGWVAVCLVFKIFIVPDVTYDIIKTGYGVEYMIS